MSKLRGFTMIEVLLVAIIIAVLVSIAVPNYIQATERARAREAISTLNAMVAAERTYNAERRTYLDLTSDAEWEAIGMENPNLNGQRSFDYTLTQGGGGFTATATRQPAGAVNATETITMTQDGTVGGTFTP